MLFLYTVLKMSIMAILELYTELEVQEIIQNIFFSLNNTKGNFYDNFELKYEKKIFFTWSAPTPLEIGFLLNLPFSAR